MRSLIAGAFIGQRHFGFGRPLNAVFLLMIHIPPFMLQYSRRISGCVSVVSQGVIHFGANTTLQLGLHLLHAGERVSQRLVVRRLVSGR